MKPPKFAADVMVGTLAKWLRLLGFDTFYSNTAEDDFLVELCTAEDRILLTRDGPLQDRMHGNACFVTSHILDEQLAQVITRYDLTRFNLPHRCAVCNGVLNEIAKAEVEGEAPPYVFKTVDEFFRCDGCGKLYWEGTHVPRIRSVIESLHNNNH